ncbi:hypothetical protein NL108_008108, partial [Boleophthalmus pectinirostris]
SREQNRLEREQRARQFYELQLQERKNRLLEQRHREERRRAAVEEKRKQRLQEERERYESAVRKTLEKSQRAQQNSQNRGRKPTKSNVTVCIFNFWTCTENFTLINALVPRRKPLTAWEKNLVTRLLTPTCSYLNRSKSAGCQGSGEQGTKLMSYTGFQRSSGLLSMFVVVQFHITPSPPPPPLTNPSPDPLPPPDPRTCKLEAPLWHSSPRKSIRRHSAPQPPELPSVPEEEVDTGLDPPCPGNTRPVRTIRAVRTSGPSQFGHWTQPLCPVRQLPEIGSKHSAGTSDPEEAARVLSEKRREARLQREQQEQEKLQREEEERSDNMSHYVHGKMFCFFLCRRNREELERRRAEERARQQAEAQRLIEEKRRREEEEQRRAEEERAQAQREAQLLLKQREEEQARERANAEKLKQERELLAQKEEVERQARKK